MKEINLREILDQVSNSNKDEDGNKVYYLWEVKKAMKEACEDTVDLCAENAKARGKGISGAYATTKGTNNLFWTFAGNSGDVYIDESSILKTKDQII